jgi:hypothetical protein
MYICIIGNSFAPVSTILPLDITAVLSVIELGSKKELSIAKCSGYHAYLKTSYD